MNYECIQFEVSKNKAIGSGIILRITTTTAIVFFGTSAALLVLKINKNSFNNLNTHIFHTMVWNLRPGANVDFERNHTFRKLTGLNIEMTPRVGHRPSFYLLHNIISGVLKWLRSPL